MLRIMVRTTIMLPDPVALRLRFEAGRRGVSMATVAREAIEASLGPEAGTPSLSIVGLGDGRARDDSERVSELVGGAIGRRHERF